MYIHINYQYFKAQVKRWRARSAAKRGSLISLMGLAALLVLTLLAGETPDQELQDEVMLILLTGLTAALAKFFQKTKHKRDA